MRGVRSGFESMGGGATRLLSVGCGGWCMISFSLLLFLSFSDVTAEPFDSRCIS